MLYKHTTVCSSCMSSLMLSKVGLGQYLNGQLLGCVGELYVMLVIQ